MASLLHYNTFHIDVQAKNFVELTTDADILALPQYASWQTALKEGKTYILGMGSNTILTQDLDGIVVHIATKGIEILEQTGTNRNKQEQTGTIQPHAEAGGDIRIKVAAGEIRDDLVRWTLDHRYRGMENLISIPGTVGAAPVQNIGAYGKEACDLIVEVHCMDKQTGQQFIFPKEACEFGYRTSIFKTTHRDRYIVTHVVFELSTDPTYQPVATYKDVTAYFAANGIDPIHATPHDVATAIATIREKKLPDWHVVGNCGSFFVNPIITQAQYDQANTQRQKYQKYNGTDLGCMPVNSHSAQDYSLISNEVKGEKWVKMYAGQLVELAGFKGIEQNGVTVHHTQSLVLINKSGTATGAAVLAYAQLIQATVKEIFGVNLAMEVNIW